LSLAAPSREKLPFVGFVDRLLLLLVDMPVIHSVAVPLQEDIELSARAPIPQTIMSTDLFFLATSASPSTVERKLWSMHGLIAGHRSMNRNAYLGC